MSRSRERRLYCGTAIFAAQRRWAENRTPEQRLADAMYELDELTRVMYSRNPRPLPQASWMKAALERRIADRQKQG